MFGNDLFFVLQAGNCDDAEVIYKFLDTNKIGETHAEFYIAYAIHLESKNKIKTANEIYEYGVSRLAAFLTFILNSIPLFACLICICCNGGNLQIR